MLIHGNLPSLVNQGVAWQVNCASHALPGLVEAETVIEMDCTPNKNEYVEYLVA